MRKTKLHFAYLHGFASSPNATKGVHLKNVFQDQFGISLHLPDMNQPSFAKLTFTSALAEIDRLHQSLVANSPADEEHKWCMIGSSMGGYLAARWGEMHPTRVHKLFLLCPGFDLFRRWPSLVGDKNMHKWLKEGSLAFDHYNGEPVKIHYQFLVDAGKHPGFPNPTCEVTVVHGKNDSVVPISTSRRFVELGSLGKEKEIRRGIEKMKRRLIEVDDGHDLLQSLPTITENVIKFFDLEKLPSDGFDIADEIARAAKL